MRYVHCPICGHKLLEGNEHSCVRVKCNKCKTILEVTIKENSVKMLPVKSAKPTTAEK